MAKKFTFDDAITTDIKGAASNSYIDRVHPNKRTYAPIGCTRSVLATL